MKKRFCITIVPTNYGNRVLFSTNQGQNHFDREEDAKKQVDDILAVSGKDRVNDIFGEGSADTIKVLPVDCYDHGDACQTVFPI